MRSEPSTIPFNLSLDLGVKLCLLSTTVTTPIGFASAIVTLRRMEINLSTEVVVGGRLHADLGFEFARLGEFGMHLTQNSCTCNADPSPTLS